MTPAEQTLFELNSGQVALTSLCGRFPGIEDGMTDAHPVSRDDLPRPYDALLAHTDHMTTTLQRRFGRAVTLRVLDERCEGDLYTRMILLSLGASGAVVEFGLVRMNLALMPEAAREEVLRRERPLGDILIRHGVLRRIDPKWFYRFGPESPFVMHFSRTEDTAAYGRVGVIHCNDQPAIQLLEVVTDAKLEG